jgi:DNA-directed RNA polymerase III subunit RPC1
LGDADTRIDLPMPSILKPTQLWTGKQVFGVLLRPNSSCKTIINLETRCRTFGKDEKNRKTGISFGDSKTAVGTKIDESFCPNDGWMVIHNSDIICGVVDKTIIGDGNKKSMFYVVMREYGAVEAANAMNRVAKLTSRWLANQGFSIGIDDVQPGVCLREEKQKTVSKGYYDCDQAILKYRAGELQNQAGMDGEATLEVFKILTIVYVIWNIEQNS